MKSPITNTYRAQILKANLGILRQLGPSVVKANQRDEIIRVIEDIVERLQASHNGAKADV